MWRSARTARFWTCAITSPTPDRENTKRPPPVGAVFLVQWKGGKGAYALFTLPNSSIFSFTVALMASKPGSSSLRGS